MNPTVCDQCGGRLETRHDTASNLIEIVGRKVRFFYDDVHVACDRCRYRLSTDESVRNRDVAFRRAVVQFYRSTLGEIVTDAEFETVGRGLSAVLKKLGYLSAVEEFGLYAVSMYEAGLAKKTEVAGAGRKNDCPVDAGAGPEPERLPEERGVS